MIRLAHPTFTREDWERLWPLLESGYLVQGRTVAEFEAGCAELLGVDRVIAVSSGTAALHLALVVLGAAPGREIVVPAFGWPSAANVVERLGAIVRLVDIEPETLAMDPALAVAALDERTTAVVPIHPFGLALSSQAWLDALGDVPVVEDAACAFGATDQSGRQAGTWGAIGCFSLHARKGLTTGEGGLLVARDREAGQRLSRLRNLGIEYGPTGRSLVEPGLNYRLTELAGALGLGQLARLGHVVTRRRELAARYLARLADVPGVVVPAGLSDAGHVFQAFVVALADGVDRAEVLMGLRERGVESTVGTIAVHLQPFYQERYRFAPDDFPVARWAHEKTIALPMHERLSEADVDAVVGALSGVIGG